MVRVHRPHHPQRASLSPLDGHRLRIKSPKLRNYPPRRNNLAYPAIKSRHLKSGTREESPLDYKFHQPRFDLTRFGRHDSPSPEDSDSEEELFQWEEEETLVNALIQNGSPAQTENFSLMSLVDSLQPSFTAQGTKVLHDLAESLVPAAKRVKNVHRVYEQDIDRTYAHGLLAFDDACQAEEAMVTRTEEQIKTAYRESKEKIGQLLSELAELYVERGRLWNNLGDVIEDTDAATCDALRSLPARTERVIADLEKRSKSLVKDDQRSSKDEAAYLKTLINKLA